MLAIFANNNLHGACSAQSAARSLRVTPSSRMDFTEKLVWQPAPFQSWGEKTDWIQEVRPEMPPFTFFIIFPYPNCRGELK